MKRNVELKCDGFSTALAKQAQCGAHRPTASQPPSFAHCLHLFHGLIGFLFSLLSA